MQKEEWSSADKTLKVHKSRLELAKEQAAAARSFILCMQGHVHHHPPFTAVWHVQEKGEGSCPYNLSQCSMLTLLLYTGGSEVADLTPSDNANNS